MIKAHNQPSPRPHEDWGSKQTHSVNQIGFRLRSLHGLSLTRPPIQEALVEVGGGVLVSPQKSATPHLATERRHHSSL